MRTNQAYFKGLFVLFALIFFNQLFAQGSANTTLNVALSDVRSITINPIQTNVTLSFANADDYINGVSNTLGSHLLITSTGGYLVKVKSSGINLVNGNNLIPANSISVTPNISAGSSTVKTGLTTVGVGFISSVQLSPSPTLLIQSPFGANTVFYDVKYAASGGGAYINKPQGTYTTTITYSIEPL